jgi:hypothetical protein
MPTPFPVAQPHGELKEVVAGIFFACRCKVTDVHAVLDLDFANLLPAHGAPVLGNARERYRPAIERAMARSAA